MGDINNKLGEAKHIEFDTQPVTAPWIDTERRRKPADCRTRERGKEAKQPTNVLRFLQQRTAGVRPLER